MRKKNMEKKKDNLYNALIKMGHCGYCACKRKQNEIQLVLFCPTDNRSLQTANNYMETN